MSANIQETTQAGRDLVVAIREDLGEVGPDFLLELIRLFLDSAPRTLAVLEEALADGDSRQAARAAHTLRGAGAQMGAKRLAELCLDLEAVADSADAGPVLQAVKREYSRIEREFSVFQGGSGHPGMS